jgi:hypothetical protein
MNGPRWESATEEAFRHITAPSRRIEPWSWRVSASIVVLVILVSGWQLTTSYLSRRNAELAAELRAKQEQELRLHLDAERQKQEQGQQQEEAKANEANERALPENLQKNAELLQKTQKDEAALSDIVNLERQLSSIREHQQELQQLISDEQALKAKHDKMRDSLVGLGKDEENQQKTLQSDEAAKAQFEGNEATGAVVKKEDALRKQVEVDQSALSTLAAQKSDTADQIANIEAQLNNVAGEKERSAATLPVVQPTFPGTASDGSNNGDLEREYQSRRSALLGTVGKENTALLSAEQPLQSSENQSNLPAANLQNGESTPQVINGPSNDQIDFASAFGFIQQHLRYVEDAQFFPNNAPNAAFQAMMADYAPVTFFHEKGPVTSEVIRTDRIGYVNTFKRRSIRNVVAVSQQRLQSANPGVGDVMQIVFQWEERIGDGQFRSYLDTWDVTKINGRLEIISERSANDKP